MTEVDDPILFRQPEDAKTIARQEARIRVLTETLSATAKRLIETQERLAKQADEAASLRRELDALKPFVAYPDFRVGNLAPICR